MPAVIAPEITRLLENRFAPVHLQVKDESHKHEGHAGARPEGETHFRVVIVSSQFEGKTRVARQREVNQALHHLLESRIHALALQCRTPQEWESARLKT